MRQTLQQLEEDLTLLADRVVTGPKEPTEEDMAALVRVIQTGFLDLHSVASSLERIATALEDRGGLI